MITNRCLADAFKRGWSISGISLFYEVDKARVENAIRIYLRKNHER